MGGNGRQGDTITMQQASDLYDQAKSGTSRVNTSSTRARANASPQLTAIWEEVKRTGGWHYTVDGTEWTYIIPSGPRAGQYSFMAGGPKFQYYPRFGSARMLPAGLLNDYTKKLAGLYEIVDSGLSEEAPRSWFGKASRQRRGTTGLEGSLQVSWDARSKWEQARYWRLGVEEASDYLKQESVAPAFEREWTTYHKDPAAYFQVRERLTPPEPAVVLYVLSQAAGRPVSDVIKALKEDPRRAQWVPNSQDVPTRLNDRIRYAKTFLDTWSHHKALKGLFTQIEGDVGKLTHQDQPGHKRMLGFQIPLVRWAFSKVPSPRQLVPTWDDQEGWPGLASDFIEHRVPKAHWLAFVKRYRSKPVGDAHHVFDMYKHAVEARAALAGMELRGRRIVEATENYDWAHIEREQDFIEATHDEWGGNKADIKKTLAFHAQGEKWSLPEGVKPLVGRNDFRREGAEMQHCVGGYFWQTESLIFAFKAPDGTRATLEIDPKTKTVRQFYGPDNQEASPQTRKLLDQFRRENPRKGTQSEEPEPMQAHMNGSSRDKRHKRRRQKLMAARRTQEKSWGWDPLPGYSGKPNLHHWADRDAQYDERGRRITGKYPSKPKNKDRTQMRSNPQEYSLQRNKRGVMLVAKGAEARPGFQVVFTGSYDDCDKAVLAEMARHEQQETQMRSVKNPWDSHRKDQILKDRKLKRADLSTAGRADLLLLIQESGSGPAAKAAQAEIDRRAAKKAAKRGGPAPKQSKVPRQEAPRAQAAGAAPRATRTGARTVTDEAILNLAHEAGLRWNRHLSPGQVKVDFNRKYARIHMQPGGALGFVDRETGDVWYPGGWKGPFLGSRPRGNVLSGDGGFGALSRSGHVRTVG